MNIRYQLLNKILINYINYLLGKLTLREDKFILYIKICSWMTERSYKLKMICRTLQHPPQIPILNFHLTFLFLSFISITIYCIMNLYKVFVKLLAKIILLEICNFFLSQNAVTNNFSCKYQCSFSLHFYTLNYFTKINYSCHLTADTWIRLLNKYIYLNYIF